MIPPIVATRTYLLSSRAVFPSIPIDLVPGPIDTGMLDRFTGTPEKKVSLAATVPLNRVGRPEEIAQTIMFLASDKASFITGASYVIDDGKMIPWAERSPYGQCTETLRR